MVVYMHINRDETYGTMQSTGVALTWSYAPYAMFMGNNYVRIETQIVIACIHMYIRHIKIDTQKSWHMKIIDTQIYIL